MLAASDAPPRRHYHHTIAASDMRRHPTDAPRVMFCYRHFRVLLIYACRDALHFRFALHARIRVRRHSRGFAKRRCERCDARRGKTDFDAIRAFLQTRCYAMFSADDVSTPPPDEMLISPPAPTRYHAVDDAAFISPLLARYVSARRRVRRGAYYCSFSAFAIDATRYFEAAQRAHFLAFRRVFSPSFHFSSSARHIYGARQRGAIFLMPICLRRDFHYSRFV